MFVCGCFPFAVTQFLPTGSQMFAGRQQWSRKHEMRLCVCESVSVKQHCAGVSTGLVIRCCADKPAIETFFHFKAPRGFSGHRLNGSRGRGVGGNRCSPWVVQSLPPSAFFFGGWVLACPLTRLKATRSPSRAPSPWHPDSD